MRRLLLALVVLAVPSAAHAKPVAAVSGPATVNAGQKATFDASSSQAGGSEIVEYAWDLDGDGTFEESRQGAKITIIPEVAGPQKLAVRITDDAGATSVAEGHYLVIGEPPTALIAGPVTAITGEDVTFDGAGSSSKSGAIEAWQWDLDGEGWGAPSARSTITTSFSEPGTYTIALRVRDAALGYGTVRREVVVTGPPVASTSGDAALGIAPLDDAARRWLTKRRFAALSGAPKRRLASARRGLWVNVVSDRPARFVLRVVVIRAGRPGRKVTTARTRLRAAGQRAFRIAIPKRSRRKLSAPARLVVRGHAVDADGNRSSVSRVFKLVR